jgi:hypothetical protein
LVGYKILLKYLNANKILKHVYKCFHIFLYVITIYNMSRGQYGLTYDTPYSRSIAKQIYDMQEKKEHLYPEEPLHFPPNYLMDGLGNPNYQVAMRGGSQYLLPATSAGYPQYNMAEAMNTASAGSRMSCPCCGGAKCGGQRRVGGDALGELKDFGIGLAKDIIRAKLMGGGKSALDELKDFGIDLGKDLLKETIRNKMSGGVNLVGDSKKMMSNFAVQALTKSNQLSNQGLSPQDQVNALGSLASMVASGKKPRKSKKDMIGGFSKKDLMNMAKSYGKSSLDDLKYIGKEVGKEVMPIVKELAVDAIKTEIKRGRGRPKKVEGVGRLKGGMKGGNTTDDILNGLKTAVHLAGEPFHMIGLPNPADVGFEVGTKYIAPAILGKKGRGRAYSFGDFSKDASKIGHEVSKELGLAELGKEVLRDSVKKTLVGKGKSGDKRSIRGAIVKKVMREHGLSLPQASKYVKEHGLA